MSSLSPSSIQEKFSDEENDSAMPIPSSYRTKYSMVGGWEHGREREGRSRREGNGARRLRVGESEGGRVREKGLDSGVKVSCFYRLLLLVAGSIVGEWLASLMCRAQCCQTQPLMRQSWQLHLICLWSERVAS